MNAVLIAVAMPAEAMPIAKRITDRKMVSVDGVPTVRGELGGRPVILVCTGVGHAAADSALRRVLVREVVADGEDGIGFVVAAGVCGALTAGLAVGDLAAAQSVVDEQSSSFAPSPDAAVLAKMLGMLGAECRPAVFLSSTKILATAAAKTAARGQLGIRDGAVVDADVDADAGVAACVDLETAAVAKAAADFGVRYVALRAVSDRADLNMPIDFARFQKPSGAIRTGRVACCALLQFWKIPGLLSLRADTRRASSLLTDAIERVLAGEVIPR